MKPNWLLRSGLRCLQCLFRTDTIYEIRSTSVDISTIVNYRARHRAIRERERGSPVCCQHARNMPYRSCWGFLPMRRIPWRNLQYAYVDREEKQYDTLSTHTVTSDTRTVENQASGRNFHFHIHERLSALRRYDWEENLPLTLPFLVQMGCACHSVLLWCRACVRAGGMWVPCWLFPIAFSSAVAAL